MSENITTEYHGDIQTSEEELDDLVLRGFISTMDAYLLKVCVVQGIPLDTVTAEEEDIPHYHHLVYDIARAKRKLLVGREVLESESS